MLFPHKIKIKFTKYIYKLEEIKRNMSFDLYEIKWALESNKEAVTYFMIFFLLFILIFWILKKTIFKENEEKKFAAITSIIISGIGVWYLSSSGFEAFVEIYRGLGMVLLFALPLLILILFLGKMNLKSYMRKLAIGAYGIVIYYVSINRGIVISEQTLLISILIILFVILFEGQIVEAISRNTAQ